MHCDRDHHIVAFLDKGYSHIHHVAFELVDWGEMRVFCDHLGQHRRPLAWGPGRHTMAQNLFAYCRMVEEEIFVELFCDMERLEPDHEPRFFADDPHGSNAWGILPPRSYFQFDRASSRPSSRSLKPSRACGIAPIRRPRSPRGKDAASRYIMYTYARRRARRRNCGSGRLDRGG